MEKVDSYHGSDFLIANQRAAEKFDVVGVNWLKDEKTVLENQKDWGERKQIWKEGTYGKVVDCWKYVGGGSFAATVVQLAVRRTDDEEACNK